MFSIRAEHSADQVRVFAVHEAAFGRPNEARLVDRLREEAAPHISLVAHDDDKGVVLGHIFLSPVCLEPLGLGIRLAGLAPVAVDPAHQGRGIGSALVREGLRGCADKGWDAVFLVGDPGYYFRFGFLPAAPLGFTYGDPKADAALQVRELTPRTLSRHRGRVVFHPAFEDFE